MENIPTWQCVVALALRDDAGRWLMHRRPPHKQHGGLWEFPGGKVEPDETPRAALVREIAEELGIAVAEEDVREAGFAADPPREGTRRLVILLYTCTRWQGEPAALEGGAVAWVTEGEMATLERPPLDVVLCDQLLAGAAT